MNAFLRKFIGDKQFYRTVLMVAVPVMIQNGITNFVGLLDNIMVGSVGTEQMSGVSIVNQLMLVFNISIFGATSGAGIFGAQFYGSGDKEGMRHTFRFKVISCLLLVALGIAIFFFAGEQLISLYLLGEGDPASIEATLHYGTRYLLIMLFGLLPFTVEQIYTSSLRECGETVVPMTAGIVAVLINLVLNYIFIFGHLGFPAMGAAGAAIATVISRYVQVLIVIVWTHRHAKRMYFIQKTYRSMYIPLRLVFEILKKGTPLMMNEILWASGMAVLTQCYSIQGLNVIAALNINSTIANLFNVVFIALGSAIAIVVGQLLGANKMEEAVDTNTKLTAFSVMCCFVLGALLYLCAPLFPMLYNTSSTVREIAAGFIRVSAICMPLYAFAHATYFTLRSGGKTIVTFLFDSCFVWCITIPFAYVITHFTGFTPIWVFFLCQSLDWVKCVIGFILVKKRIWVNRLVIEA